MTSVERINVKQVNSSTICNPLFHEYSFPCSAQPTGEWSCTFVPPVWTHTTLPLPLNINSKFSVAQWLMYFFSFIKQRFFSSSLWDNFGHIPGFLWRGVPLFAYRVDTDCNSRMAHNTHTHTHPHTHTHTYTDTYTPTHTHTHTSTHTHKHTRTHYAQTHIRGWSEKFSA